MSLPQDLIQLARYLGNPTNDLCLLAEGNVSCADGDNFWIKASGHTMWECNPDAFVQARTAPIAQALDATDLTEHKARELLDKSVLPLQESKKASTESYMHAWLLGLDDIRFVAHSHPPALISILSLESAANYATTRLFPDEVVFCGPAACYVSYAAPGQPLAVEIRSAVRRFQERYNMNPKTIWLQNHGLIALGRTARDCELTTTMSVKAARVLLGTLSTGKPLRSMTEQEVMQIWNWTDEHYRRNLLSSNHSL